MADIIQLLPDSIANQIAAGEVIQRPASVVKELVENAVDAGSTEIKVILKDGGKALIQIIDNGCGMSETDARMAFERHATSKIRKAKDLFAIRTMGFRGEALASIAAIAHVELKTRRQSDDLGTKIIMEGSAIVTQEPCQCSAGTSFAIKNLFYNVPARRNFLKSHTVEMRHILEEFQRIALANPDIFFSLHHNGSELFHLTKGNLRQRIVGIYGNTVNKKLVPVEEDTDIIKINGYIGKPEFSKKTRGEQLFFVNHRFIKSPYLNHAVVGAFDDLLPKDTYPFYIIFIEIDPSKIDINVHPTKQEIKFEDERLLYNYMKVAIKHALGQYSITPSLDFEQENSFSNYTGSGPKIKTGNQSDFSQSKNVSGSNARPAPAEDAGRHSSNLKNWEKIYKGLDEFDSEETTTTENSVTIKSKWSDDQSLDDETGSFSKQHKPPYQLHATYIVSQIKSGFLLIDQQAAHERILYEQYLDVLKDKKNYTQKELFPKTINVSTSDALVIKAILPQINSLGFDIQEFGADTFVIHGVPADLPSKKDPQELVESLLSQYKNNLDLKLDINENLARSMAGSSAIKKGQNLNPAEMKELIDKLFACSTPYKSPSGKNCFVTYELDELARRFNAE